MLNDPNTGWIFDTAAWMQMVPLTCVCFIADIATSYALMYLIYVYLHNELALKFSKLNLAVYSIELNVCSL